MYINPTFKKEDSQKYLVSIISSPKSIVGYGTKGADIDDLLYVQDSEMVPDEVKKYIKKWGKKSEMPKLLKLYIKECKRMRIGTRLIW